MSVGTGAQRLTRTQAVLLQAVLPIVVIGFLLPIGVAALALELGGASAAAALDHGELFLAGGNAAFTGCLVLISARPDKAMGAAICFAFVVCFVVMPCYGAWADISTAAARHASYSTDVAMHRGLAAAIIGFVLAAAMSTYALAGPWTAPDPAAGA